jgi:histidyl-tRNA synthetase
VLNFFWVDRIYLVVEELIFSETVTESSKVYYYGDTEVLRLCRQYKSYEVGIKVELYPDNAKVAKQFQHADKSIPLQ